MLHLVVQNIDVVRSNVPGSTIRLMSFNRAAGLSLRLVFSLSYFKLLSGSSDVIAIVRLIDGRRALHCLPDLAWFRETRCFDGFRNRECCRL